MPQRKNAKYDWKKLKEEFFSSEFLEMSEFIRAKKLPNTSYTRRRMTGWRKEKEEWQDKIFEESMAEIAKAQKKRLRVGLNKLIDEGILAKINHPLLSGYQVSDLRGLFAMMMTLNDRPTTVSSVNHGGEIKQIQEYDMTKLSDTALAELLAAKKSDVA